MASTHNFGHDGSDRDDGVGGGDDDSAQDSGGARDNEFYSLLNVSRTATDAEITAAYKKFARLYHPDKHMDPERKKKAEVMFDKLKKAHEVLSDPHQRAIYDCLGKKGLEEKGWEIVQRVKTPREIRDEYEALARAYAERRKLQQTNPTSRVQMTVNCTDLFERYLYDEEFDDVIDANSGLPSLEITEISFGQTVNCPLSNVDNVVLSGNVSTRSGNGDGSVGAAWRRTTSDRNWFEVDAKLGSNSSSSATYFHRLTAKTFVNMSGSIQLAPRVKPSFSISLGNQMGPSSVGYLSYSSDWSVWETDEDIVLSQENSGMSTMVVHDVDRLRLVASLQFGIPHTYLLLSAVKKFDESSGLKVSGSVRAGTFGAVLKYGVERKLTHHSTLGATMAFGLPIGVTLTIKVTRGQQTYLFPLHLADEILVQPILYGTVIPLVGYFTFKKLILDPIEERRRAQERERQMEAAREKVAEARKEAAASIDLMRERFNRIRHDEASRGGLVIVAAVYGKLLDDSGELLISLDGIPLPTSPSEGGDYASSPGAVRLRELLMLGSAAAAAVDVTVPVQCLVEDSGRLSLQEATKAELAGFYDPAPADEEKQLLVRYLYQSRVHQVVVGDSEGLRLPKNAHRVASSGTTTPPMNSTS